MTIAKLIKMLEDFDEDSEVDIAADGSLYHLDEKGCVDETGGTVFLEVSGEDKYF